jgi:hypothetical protein
MGDELTNAALIGLIGMFVLALILRAAGRSPRSSPAPPTRRGRAPGSACCSTPPTPRPRSTPTVSTRSSTGSSPAVPARAARRRVWWVWIVLRRHTGRPRPTRTASPGSPPPRGHHRASRRHCCAGPGNCDPRSSTPTPEDVGYLLGASRGTKVWASVEDSILLIGPPRSGKGLHVVINAILDAPGAVVTTSTRPDNLTATLRARARRAAGRGVRPAAPRRRHPRRAALVADPGVRGPADRDDPRHRPRRRHRPVRRRCRGGGFWEGKTRTALQACCTPPPSITATGRVVPVDPRPLRRADAVAILTREPERGDGVGDSLAGDDRRRPQDPRLHLARRLPRPRRPRRPARARRRESPARTSTSTPNLPLRKRGTLYLLATGAGANNSPPRWWRRSWKTSSKPPAASPPAHPEPGSTRPCCSRSMRSATSPPAVAADADGRRRRHRDHDDAGVAVPRPGAGEVERERRPARSGTPASSRSSSAAHPTAATSKTSPPSSGSATSHRLHTSATTAPARTNAPSAGSRSCRPTASAPSHSAPASSCCAPHRRSSPTCVPGPTARTRSAAAATAPNSKLLLRHPRHLTLVWGPGAPA